MKTYIFEKDGKQWQVRVSDDFTSVDLTDLKEIIEEPRMLGQIDVKQEKK